MKLEDFTDANGRPLTFDDLRYFAKQQFSVDNWANGLYLSTEELGMQKGTDKTQWREASMAGKLRHKVHPKISSGAGSDEYGSDALNEETGKFSEYKSNAVVDRQLRNFYELPKGNNGQTFAPLVVKGVYNGAYKESAIEAYTKIDHYFGVFWKEEVLLIIKVNTDEVIRQLTENNAKRKPGKTTNCNNVSISLRDIHLYEIAYKREGNVIEENNIKL